MVSPSRSRPAAKPPTTGRVAVFPGMFDPLTLGHLDVIRRGRALFDHLVIAIGVNPNKQPFLSIEQRLDLVGQVVAPMEGVSVQVIEGLTVQFARSLGARFILRGLRTLSDMEYEFSMTLTNQRLDPEIETVFLMADGEYANISSSLIKQVARFGGAEAVSRFVPPALVDPIMAAARTAALDRPEEGR